MIHEHSLAERLNISYRQSSWRCFSDPTQTLHQDLQNIIQNILLLFLLIFSMSWIFVCSPAISVGDSSSRCNPLISASLNAFANSLLLSTLCKHIRSSSSHLRESCDYSIVPCGLPSRSRHQQCPTTQGQVPLYQPPPSPLPH